MDAWNREDPTDSIDSSYHAEPCIGERCVNNRVLARNQL